MYSDLINAASPLLLLFMTEECIKSVFLDFNLLDFPCLKMALSKGLGYAIVMGSVLVKFPQILKIYGSGSVVGLALSTFLLETFCAMINVGYNYAQQFPFSTWGENFFILIQLIIILIQLFYYSDRTLLALICPLVIPALSLGISKLPTEHLAIGLTAAIPLLALSKLMQIKANFQNGHTGQLSFVTSLMNVLGTLARLFTVVQEVEDKIILMNAGSVFVLNFIIIAQFVVYWNVTPPTAAEKKTQ
eukprot:sb/3468890/